MPIDFQWLRTPETQRIFSLNARPGVLRLYGRESIASWFEQAIVARRQQHFNFTAETALDFAPTDERQMAGLLLYYGRYNFHYLAVTAHSDGKRELLLMSSEASFPNGQLSFPGAPIPIPDQGQVRLKMVVKNSVLAYFYAIGDAAFTAIAPTLDASLISDECGGHAEHGSFTGAFVALGAHDLNGLAAPADFHYMTYEPEKGPMDV